ncbi:MAG: hypothetical protein GXP30_09565, partial [Verrucomicrobia bacterium]|nr:hypothetical protein [Verrucomicrobiota bacterium]
TKQVYQTPEGLLASEAFYGSDGFKTEYIKYDIRAGRIGQITRRWTYMKGRPVKVVQGGKVVFDQTKR